MQRITLIGGDMVKEFDVEIGMTPAVTVTQGVVQVKFRNRQHLDVDIITHDTVIIEETIV
jgi:hypothetical protein